MRDYEVSEKKYGPSGVEASLRENKIQEAACAQKNL
jgi:hypothetical protein